MFAMKIICASLVLVVGVTHGLRWPVMGDWGGAPTAPFTTEAEIRVAAAMNELVTSFGSESAGFTMALGDNAYTTGYKNVDDPRFKETFENVFNGKALQYPYEFKILLGNHDHYGNASAELAYSAVSKRWVIPNYWYTFETQSADGATIQIVMIDTVILAGNSDDMDDSSKTLPGPADPELAATEIEWIEQTLAASTADFLIVAGHYPIYSVCEHGPTANLIDELLPLMERYNASAYLAGHDHCAEAIWTGRDSGMQHHGVGAAHGLDPSLAHQDAVPPGSLKYHYGEAMEDFDESNGAYASVEVTKAGMVVTHLKDDNTVLFTAPAIAPRNKQ